MQAHKIIRAINRRCDIALLKRRTARSATTTLSSHSPTISTPPVCEIGDADYAIFLQDIMDQPEKYRNKTVSLKGKAITKSRSLEEGILLLRARRDDLLRERYPLHPLAAEAADTEEIKNLAWYKLTARIDIRTLPDVYEGPGPVLHMVSIEPCDVPEQEVATFY